LYDAGILKEAQVGAKKRKGGGGPPENDHQLYKNGGRGGGDVKKKAPNRKTSFPRAGRPAVEKKENATRGPGCEPAKPLYKPSNGVGNKKGLREEKKGISEKTTIPYLQVLPQTGRNEKAKKNKKEEEGSDRKMSWI